MAPPCNVHRLQRAGRTRSTFRTATRPTTRTARTRCSITYQREVSTHQQCRHGDDAGGEQPTAATTGAVQSSGGNGVTYLVGNAGNGTKSATTATLADQLANTGVQIVTPGSGGDDERRDLQHHAEWVCRGQAEQGQQLPGRDDLQQHAVCDQGQRRQRDQHRLSGGHAGHAADREQQRDHDPAGLHHHASGGQQRRRIRRRSGCSLPTRRRST